MFDDQEEELSGEPGNSYAQQLIRSGRKSAALSQVNNLLEFDASDVVALTDRGHVLQLLGDNRNAIRDLDKAAELSPENAVIYRYRGRAYGQMGNTAKALQDFKRAIRLDPRDWRSLKWCVHVHITRKDFVAALEVCERLFALGLTAAEAEAYHHRAWIYRETRKYKESLEDYNRAIQLRPAYYHTFVGRGWTYWWLGERELAVADFTRGIELAPDKSSGYAAPACIYFWMKKYDLALSDYTSRLEQKGGRAEHLTLRARVHLHLGNLHECANDVREAMKLKPDIAASYRKIWEQVCEATGEPIGPKRPAITEG